MRLRIPNSIKNKFYDLEDAFFERRHGLDLNGIVPSGNLVAADISSGSHASAYQAAWCSNLRELFAQAKKVSRAFEYFVDVGSGKGKACFFAARTSLFDKMIGVEFSAPLVQVANSNRERFGNANITFLNGDANEYLLPDGKSLVFLFNPFDDVILEKFISNNVDHFRKHRSLIAYSNDIHRATLTRLGFETIFSNPGTKNSLFRYAGAAAPA